MAFFRRTSKTDMISRIAKGKKEQNPRNNVGLHTKKILSTIYVLVYVDSKCARGGKTERIRNLMLQTNGRFRGATD